MTITIDYNKVGFGTIQRNARIASQGQILNQNNNHHYAHKVNQSEGFWDPAGFDIAGVNTYVDVDKKDGIADGRFITHFEVHVYGQYAEVRVDIPAGTPIDVICGATEGWYKELYAVSSPGEVLEGEITYQIKETTGQVGFLKGAFVVGLRMETTDLP